MSSNNTAPKELLKKTYRITQAEQQIISRLMTAHGLKTESALLSYMLGTYEKLEADLRESRWNAQALERAAKSHHDLLCRFAGALDNVQSAAATVFKQKPAAQTLPRAEHFSGKLLDVLGTEEE